jgi:hypothetical protein
MSMSLRAINRAASSVYGGMMRNEDKQERKMSATQNLARVLGFTDHGDRCGAINLTQEPTWTSWR